MSFLLYNLQSFLSRSLENMLTAAQGRISDPGLALEEPGRGSALGCGGRKNVCRLVGTGKTRHVTNWSTVDMFFVKDCPECEERRYTDA